MKKIFILIIISLTLISVNAKSQQSRRSKLVIRMWDNSFIIVSLDNKTYNNPVAKFRLDNIRPGEHKIVISTKIGGRYGRGYQKLIYDGNINIPRASKVFAKINRYNNLVITRTERLNSGYYNGGGSYYNLPVLHLYNLKRSLRRTSFDSDRRIIAEQAVSTHTVRAEQIYQIMLLFSFESTKVKFAKFAYRYCFDKNNYYRVNDALTFSSSIRELNNFIGSYGSDYYDDSWQNEDWDDDWNDYDGGGW